jgi:cytochrome c oxidase cbb3-type subunit 3
MNRICVPLLLLPLLGAAECTHDAATPVALRTQAPASPIGPQPGPDEPRAVLVNPHAGDRTVLAEGRRLFNWYNCSGCHGDHGGGGMGPSLRDSLWYYGGDAPSLYGSITQGRDKGMPSWGGKVPDDQVWKIVTYIQSMRTPDEPDAPR